MQDDGRHSSSFHVQVNVRRQSRTSRITSHRGDRSEDLFFPYRSPIPSNRQHLSCGDSLEGKREDYLTSSVLLCIITVHIICTPI